jgi:hypothetical protein
MLCVMNIQEVVKHLNFIHITHELQSISHGLREKLSLNLRFQNVKKNVDFVIKKWYECQLFYNFIIMSPLWTKGDIVLVWFFLPLLLLLSEVCPDHNIFVFPDRSMIFGMWVHDHKADVSRNVMTFVGPWPLTSRSNNCFLNSIFLSRP